MSELWVRVKIAVAMLVDWLTHQHSTGKLWHPVVIGLSDKWFDRLTFGLKKNASAINFIIIIYRKGTHPAVLEQEKIEAWWTVLSLTLAGLIICVTSGTWFMLLAIPHLIVYPLPFLIPYPKSHIFRQFFEIRSHIVEIREWVRIEKPTRHEYLQKLHRQTTMLIKYYNLKMGYSEVWGVIDGNVDELFRQITNSTE